MKTELKLAKDHRAETRKIASWSLVLQKKPTASSLKKRELSIL
jgi:hypothetical protein